METATSLLLDHPFWQFSLRVYAVPEAAAECLHLQCARSINVNVLLFCSWIAVSRRIALDAADIELIENEIHDWHTSIVQPLREIRDRLKSSPEMRLREVQAFRHQLLADELHAEQIEQALIFQRAECLPVRQGAGTARDIVAGNIRLLCSLSPALKLRDAPISVSALVEASLAHAGD